MTLWREHSVTTVSHTTFLAFGHLLTLQQLQSFTSEHHHVFHHDIEFENPLKTLNTPEMYHKTSPQWPLQYNNDIRLHVIYMSSECIHPQESRHQARIRYIVGSELVEMAILTNSEALYEARVHISDRILHHPGTQQTRTPNQWYFNVGPAS